MILYSTLASDNVLQYRLANATPAQSSFEAIKAMYYQEMRKFLMTPLTFRGCRDSSSTKKLIFQSILFRHMDDIVQTFQASNELFLRLELGLEQFKEWVILGQVDIEELVEKYLQDVNDWEGNFRTLKMRGQEAEKLPK